MESKVIERDIDEGSSCEGQSSPCEYFENQTYGEELLQEECMDEEKGRPLHESRKMS